MFNFTAFFSMSKKMFKKFSPNRGFSLVEMLTVIAIIGIFAGIILVAMNPARERAKEARISSDLVQLQNQAEILYLEEGDYSKVDCASGASEIIALCDDVADQGSPVQIFLSPSTREYCASATLSAEEEFCVDYQGFADRVISSSCSSPPYLCVVSLCLAPVQYIVFVANNPAGGSGGLYAADELGPTGVVADSICQALADGADLIGSYTAWISGGTSDEPRGRGLANCAAAGADSAAWFRVDGTKVADNWIDLTDGTIDATIDRNETGVQPGGTNRVWTGTATDGSSMSDHCLGWTSTSIVEVGVQGQRGQAGGTWTNWSPAACDGGARIYCFQHSE